MKIHSDTLTLSDFRDAAQKAGVTIVSLDAVGSRSRKQAWRFYLSGSASHRSQSRASAAQAATWDEWGIFFAHLFDVDPLAHCGKNGYQSAEHYHWTTGNRFRALWPQWQHKRHKWIPQGSVATGAYYVYACDCGATQRHMAHGRQFAELSAV